MSFGGRVARGLLIAAVAAAVGAATLPVLLKQTTPTEEAIARVAVPPPHPNEGAKPATVAAGPLVVPFKVNAAYAAVPATAEEAVVPQAAAVVASIPTPAEPPPAITPDEPPPVAIAAPIASPAPPATGPDASATHEPFPPVQPLIIEASANPPPATERAAVQPDVPAATAGLLSRGAEKPAWRKHANHRTTQRRYLRPRPFSIRALLAALHLR